MSDPTLANRSDDELFVGYNWPMPPTSARFVARASVALATVGVAAAVFLAAGHVRLQGGHFEFGRLRTVAGVVIEKPYPMLRPNDSEDAATPWPLLVAPGKHGAGAIVSGLEGRAVELAGTRVSRGAHGMLEVQPGSVTPMREMMEAENLPGVDAGERVTLRGEIVDSKCFLGVMVPGAGKTHRECASLCLRGSIPPALFVRDGSGNESLWLLVDLTGKPVSDRARALVGEPVEMTGITAQQGGWMLLRTDPEGWRPLSR